MKKKILKIAFLVVVILALCTAGLIGWLFYQMRDIRPIETAKLSDSLFVLKGKISNVYLVKSKNDYVAFDAGDDPKKIEEACKILSIDPAAVRAVFITHSDADHVDGLPAFPAAKVYLSKDEVPLLKEKAHRHFFGMGHMNSLPVKEYSTLSDGDRVKIGDIVVQAIATPGHTQGSMCFQVGKAVFTGDLCLIINGRVQPMLKIFTEDVEMNKASIRKIAGLKTINSIYTAHTGYTTDLKKALETWK